MSLGGALEADVVVAGSGTGLPETSVPKPSSSANRAPGKVMPVLLVTIACHRDAVTAAPNVTFEVIVGLGRYAPTPLS